MTRSVTPLGQLWTPRLTESHENCILGSGRERLNRKAPPQLLERFCEIAEAADTRAAVIAFAKKWGVLGLCEHGLPCGHSAPPCRPGPESIQHWKEFAVFLDSMLRIGLELNRRKRGQTLDWQLVAKYFPSDPFERWFQWINQSQGKIFDALSMGILSSDVIVRMLDIRLARTLYSFLVQRLIEDSGLRHRFQWSDGAWNSDLDSPAYSNLPAVLTAQLMLRVSSAKAQIRCSECSRWFIPRRNQRKYCNNCGIRAAWRAAQRKVKGK